MPIKWNELFDLLVKLSEIKGLKITAYNSVKGGLITGAATVLGGLLLGKYGFLLGAATGGAISAALADDFEPVWKALKDLPEHEKQELVQRVINAFKNVGIQDVVIIATYLLSDESIQSIAIAEITSYFQENKDLMVVSNI